MTGEAGTAVGPAEVVRQIGRTTGTVVAALEGLDEVGLRAPSALPRWSRLTIACHLRYGAQALLRMTDDVAAGRPPSFYPEGRDAQRPGTLEPGAAESPAAVVDSLREASGALAARWRTVTDWDAPVVEPGGAAHLGPVTLGRLAILRLTEVEVHGTDLGLGLGPWSDTFVRAALPMRLAWLPSRRSNHRPVPGDVRRSWLLAATDAGPTTRLAVDGATVTSTPVPPGAPVPDADVVIEAPSRELLALLLGRSSLPVAADFNRAFPGP
ncbi:MAG TPA: maleylpyruvate isomerase family mycothiol-dependent enzyme [Acidimicrobiales bacterium]